MSEVIEGKWEDLVARQDLRGRSIWAIVFDDAEKGKEDPWLQSFHAWADSHEPVEQWVDDSRESIYSGTMDDPR